MISRGDPVTGQEPSNHIGGCCAPLERLRLSEGAVLCCGQGAQVAQVAQTTRSRCTDRAFTRLPGHRSPDGTSVEDDRSALHRLWTDGLTWTDGTALR